MKCSDLETLFTKYQNPDEVDKLIKIEKDLGETKEILLKSINDLMKRGDQLEDLAQKSNDLSFHSKAFMKSGQDLNKCCKYL